MWGLRERGLLVPSLLPRPSPSLEVHSHSRPPPRAAGQLGNWAWSSCHLVVSKNTLLINFLTLHGPLIHWFSQLLPSSHGVARYYVGLWRKATLFIELERTLPIIYVSQVIPNGETEAWGPRRTYRRSHVNSCDKSPQTLFPSRNRSCKSESPVGFLKNAPVQGPTPRVFAFRKPKMGSLVVNTSFKLHRYLFLMCTQAYTHTQVENYSFISQGS